jgi:hypothetical protein
LCQRHLDQGEVGQDGTGLPISGVKLDDDEIADVYAFHHFLSFESQEAVV